MSASLGLNAAQQRAIVALLAGATHAEAAASARRSVRSIRSWLTQERFTSELDARSADIYASAIRRLKAGADDAAAALTGQASGRLPPTSARVAACRAVLELARNATEIAELEDLVLQLAAKLEQKRGLPQ